jgi:hypothetical protein
LNIKYLVVLSLCAVSAVSFARGGSYGGGSHGYHSTGTGEHYVSGYTRSNGTYVTGHYQTNSNDTRYDNWSSRGNVNPHTGKEGTIDPTR